MSDRAAILLRRRRLVAAAAVTGITLAPSHARPQICLSDVELEPPPCETYRDPLDVTSLGRLAKCHAADGKLDAAREAYQQLIDATRGMPEMEHERKRAEWEIQRIDLVQYDARNPRKGGPPPEPVEPAPAPESPRGVEVLARPHRVEPSAGCGCEAGPARPHRGLWLAGALALLATAARAQRRKGG